ncbi:hypothetical protein BURMUCGD1_3974 [Burkholderia multivorans CGD1]|nr:hypothetical protein BURMUCGD1_3974 [Burkholderia multivorans CGD1]
MADDRGHPRLGFGCRHELSRFGQGERLEGRRSGRVTANVRG